MPGFMVNGTGGGPDGGPDGKAEARRTYRWVFRILSGFPNRDAFLYLKTARRPQVTFQEIPQHRADRLRRHVPVGHLVDLHRRRQRSSRRRNVRTGLARQRLVKSVAQRGRRRQRAIAPQQRQNLRNSGILIVL